MPVFEPYPYDAADRGFVSPLLSGLPGADPFPQATLTVVGDPGQLPNLGNLVDDRQGPFLYSWMHTSYPRDNGLTALPVGGPPGTIASFSRLHAGAWYRLDEFAFVRVLNPPDVPQPNASDPNYVLVAGDLSAPCVYYLPDGTPVYGRGGYYLYALQVPPSPGDTILFTGSPLSGSPAGNNDLSADEFEATLSAFGPVTGGPPSGINF